MCDSNVFVQAADLKPGDRIKGYEQDASVKQAVHTCEEDVDIVKLRTDDGDTLEVTADHRLVIEGPRGEHVVENAGSLVAQTNRRILLDTGFIGVSAVKRTTHNRVVRIEFTVDIVVLAIAAPQSFLAVYGSSKHDLTLGHAHTFLQVTELVPDGVQRSKSCSPSFSGIDWYGRKTCLSLGALEHNSPIHPGSNCTPCRDWRRGHCKEGKMCSFCHLPHVDPAGRPCPRRDNLRRRPKRRVDNDECNDAAVFIASESRKVF